ncbi:MAG: hypothetical protein RLW62_24525 [Gammaproteobacteria bacterium]
MPRMRRLRPGPVLLVLLAAAVLVASAWAVRRPPPETAAPYARWRNGVIVHVRNCEAPASDDAVARCAALHCARRVTELLTNPQQATLTLTRYGRAADGTGFTVEGTLDQYLRAPTLPTGFVCHMRDPRDAAPEFLFTRRQASGTL